MLLLFLGYTKIQSIYEPLCDISIYLSWENVSALEDNKHFGSSALNSKKNKICVCVCEYEFIALRTSNFKLCTYTQRAFFTIEFGMLLQFDKSTFGLSKLNHVYHGHWIQKQFSSVPLGFGSELHVNSKWIRIIVICVMNIKINISPLADSKWLYLGGIFFFMDPPNLCDTKGRYIIRIGWMAINRRSKWMLNAWWISMFLFFFPATTFLINRIRLMSIWKWNGFLVFVS